MPGVAGASLVLGGLTSLAQTFPPEALTPLANSSSGWTVLTALLVWFARPSTRVAAGATLFGLSILARYEPETWGRAIDINASREAVAIEHILNAAMDSVPELLYRALIGAA